MQSLLLSCSNTIEAPLNSPNDPRAEVSRRLTGGAIRLIAPIVLLASARAQPVPASISTVPEPTSARPFFDASGNSYYLTGTPTPGAAQTQSGGGTCTIPGFGGIPIPSTCPDAQVMKADPSGNEIWGTLLGGPTADSATALAIANNGNVAFTGSTGGQFPTTPGVAVESSTTATAFAAMVTSDGSKFVYSTYLPPSVAAASSIAVDTAGNAYIAGTTSAGHAFVLKLSADGSSIIYDVVLAGSGADAATAIAVDPSGNAVVTGQTTSPDFPVTAGAFGQRLKGTQNGFLVRLDPLGNILSSTYFGGSGADTPSSMAVDAAGHIDLAGSTSSLDLPVTQGTMQPSTIVPAWNNSSPAGFVAQFEPDGLSLNWASYVMSAELLPNDGNWDFGVSAFGVAQGGDIYIGGRTGPGFPVTPSAPEICFEGSTNRTNGFLAHLNSKGALLDATYLGDAAGGDVVFAGSLMPLPGGSVLMGWRDTATGLVSSIQFGSGGWTAPACLSTDVLNSATLSGSGGIAPGELISLTGFGIGPDIGVGSQPDAQGNLPTELAGVQMLVGGMPAPILYAQSRLINIIAPNVIAPGAIAPVTVTYNNQQFGPVPATAATIGSPGIVRLDIGQSAQAAAINQDGTLNGPANPAPRGSVVSVWATGYGQTNPPCSPGGLNVPYAAPLGPGISALIESYSPLLLTGLKAPPVQYAGSAPAVMCGVEQINFQIPLDAVPGAFSFEPWIQFMDATTTSQYQPLVGATIFVK
jgi:uncharacterized protein (TIGR03437 family)